MRCPGSSVIRGLDRLIFRSGLDLDAFQSDPLGADEHFLAVDGTLVKIVQAESPVRSGLRLANPRLMRNPY